MPFKPGREPVTPDFKRLNSTLNNSGVKVKDYPLYQIIKALLENSQQSVQHFTSQINGINQSIAEISAGGGSGGGTTPIPPVIIENGVWYPLTDGDVDETDLIFADGECIMVFVPNP